MSEAPPSFDAAFAARLEALLRWRRDVRHFTPRPVAEADMAHLLETACLAPSVGNAQPWRFVRIRAAALREALAAHVDAASAAAAEGYDAATAARYRALKLHGIGEAPELLAVFSDPAPVAGHGLGQATMPETLAFSTVMAIHTLWLAARARGIGMGWVSILDPDHVTTLLSVPAGWRLIALLCIGYADEAAARPELERLGWQARIPADTMILDR